jgi:hypothetical protein
VKSTLQACCVKHAHVSQTLLASLYVYRSSSLLVLYISTYVLHLYKQRSNKTYSCSRLIKLAQATKAQNSASSNMAAQACASLPKRCYQINCQFQDRVLSAISNIKYREYVLLIICPNWHFQPRNIWDPDTNYPATIPIIEHAYLLLTVCSMHALSSPPGINYFTHRTQQTRYRLIGAYTQGTDAQLTSRNHRAAPRA